MKPDRLNSSQNPRDDIEIELEKALFDLTKFKNVYWKEKEEYLNSTNQGVRI